MGEQIRGEARVRVRYAETDQMGVVYHANYIVWFEVGRVELMRQLGLDYKAMERDEGCMIAVVEVSVRYKAPARYDDELIVRTSMVQARSPIVKFTYEIVRAEDGVLLCEGATTHVVVGRDMKRAHIPERYVAAFQKAMGESTESTPTP